MFVTLYPVVCVLYVKQLDIKASITVLEFYQEKVFAPLIPEDDLVYVSLTNI